MQQPVRRAHLISAFQQPISLGVPRNDDIVSNGGET